jgi:hypothetical protein
VARVGTVSDPVGVFEKADSWILDPELLVLGEHTFLGRNQERLIVHVEAEAVLALREPDHGPAIPPVCAKEHHVAAVAPLDDARVVDGLDGIWHVVLCEDGVACVAFDDARAIHDTSRAPFRADQFSTTIR